MVYELADIDDIMTMQAARPTTTQTAQITHTKPVATKTCLIKELPPGVDLSGIDIDRPPQIAGEICDLIRMGAHRELKGGAYAAMAIQCLAMAGAGIQGIKGSKTSLITITLAVSASGKERPQSVIKGLLSGLDLPLYGDIASTKDIIRGVFYGGGRAFYIKDEAHSLLGNGKRDSYAEGIPAMIMEMITTDRYKPINLHANEFLSEIGTQITRLQKQVTAKQSMRDGYNRELEQAKIQKICLEIDSLEAEIDELESMKITAKKGIPNPAFNLAGSSTPHKLASIITEDSVQSGFLGRALIFDCGDERQPRNFDLLDRYDEVKKEEHKRSQMLSARIASIHQMAKDNAESRLKSEFEGVKFGMVSSPEAESLIRAIAVHYDSYEYINHGRIGALYSRLDERVASVASVLALDNLINGQLVVEPQHVLYALKAVLASISHLEANLYVNTAAESDDSGDHMEGLKQAILKRLDVTKGDKSDGWRYKSAIKDKIKRLKFYKILSKKAQDHGQCAFENALSMLISEQKITSDGKKLKRM